MPFQNVILIGLAILGTLWALVGIPAGLVLIWRIVAGQDESSTLVKTLIIAATSIPVLLIIGIFFLLWTHDFDLQYFAKWLT